MAGAGGSGGDGHWQREAAARGELTCPMHESESYARGSTPNATQLRTCAHARLGCTGHLGGLGARGGPRVGAWGWRAEKSQ
jgi:hypothetical protein